MKVATDFARGRKSLLEVLQQFALSNPQPGSEVNCGIETAKPVDIHCLSLPALAAQCDPREHLTGRKLRAYDNMDRLGAASM